MSPACILAYTSDHQIEKKKINQKEKEREIPIVN